MLANRQVNDFVWHMWSQFATSSITAQMVTRSEATHVGGRCLGALRRYCRHGSTAAMNDPLAKEKIDPLIRTIRGYRVVLDADLARLYGVSTKALNQAVRRNADRFPADFVFQLDWSEWDDLRSHVVTSTPQPPEFGNKSWNRSQIVTGSQKHRDKRFAPSAFTEHGALMAANILRSDRAVQMSVFVVRAFIRLREHAAANTAVMARLAEIDKTLLQHDAALRDLYRKLLPLLQPQADPPKRRIGFHTDDS